MPDRIIIDKNVSMEMRDGTLLRGDVYRQSDRQKHPGILVRTPYNKLNTGQEHLKIMEAVTAGYVVVVQDVRGRFASEGEFQLHNDTAERHDGYDSVEWIASQNWCDGNVGMMGGSYLGQLQWAAAMEKPPHLKAISPWICPAWWAGHDEPRLGGASLLRQAISWGVDQAFEITNRLEKEGKDVAEMRNLLNQATSNPEIFYNILPLKDMPLTRFEGLKEIWQEFMDAEYRKSEKNWNYHQVEVPCYHAGSWYDFFTWATFDNYFGMKQDGGSAYARQNQYIIVGPWAHGGALPGFLGGISYGASASSQGARIGERNLCFFDRYLKGKDVELSSVRYFVMGQNIWRETETWPLPQTKWTRFFLHSKGNANTANGDGFLTRDEPASETTDHFVYDPLNPVPSTGVRGMSPVPLVAGPIDQSHIEKRTDILCYTTPELTEDTEVTGPLKLHLFAASTAKDTDFVAKLVDVYPDGRSFNVSDGVIRARYRKSVVDPELITPGEINEYVIDMAHTSQLFKKGHHIRVDVTSSNFPYLDRNMNTGHPFGEDAQGIVATQTIYHQGGFASFIDLPIQPVID